MNRLIFILLALIAFSSLSISTVLSQEIDYCEGNFDYDEDVDGTDASVFKNDFGRSSFSSPCPPPNPSPAPLTKTGQTKCYGWIYPLTEIPCPQPGETLFGQDGNYQKGVTTNPRFTANSDGTVTDNVTGLMWEVKSNYDDIVDFDNPNDADNMYHWQGALALCEDLILNNDGEWTITTSNPSGAKYDDWRLPNIRELESLVDYSKFNPTIDTDCFPDTSGTTFYWSSTTCQYNAYNAWGIAFYRGYLIDQTKTALELIRAVRGGL